MWCLCLQYCVSENYPRWCIQILLISALHSLLKTHSFCYVHISSRVLYFFQSFSFEIDMFTNKYKTPKPGRARAALNHELFITISVLTQPSFRGVTLHVRNNTEKKFRKTERVVESCIIYLATISSAISVTVVSVLFRCYFFVIKLFSHFPFFLGFSHVRHCSRSLCGGFIY